MPDPDFGSWSATLRKKLKVLEEVASLKPAAPDFADKLEKGLRRWGETASPTELAELRATGEALVSRLRVDSQANCRRYLREFVDQTTRAGGSVREVATNRWRVGPLVLVLSSRGQCRAEYGDHPVTDWAWIRSAEDFSRIHGAASECLKNHELTDAEIVPLFDRAYVLAEAIEPRSPNKPGIHIFDFQRALRAAIALAEIAKDAGGSLHRTSFPTWAFVYNVDRYRKLGRAQSDTDRVYFETGSQTMKGMLFGYLDQSSDPMKLAWVKRVGGR